MVSWDQADLTVGDPEPSLMSHDAGDELSRAVQSDHEVVDSWQEWFYGDAGPRTPVSAGHSVGLSATNVALPSALTAEEPSKAPSRVFGPQNPKFWSFSPPPVRLSRGERHAFD